MRPARRACIAAGLAVLLLAGIRPASVEAQPSDSLTFGSLPAALPRASGASFWARHRTPALIAGAVATVGSLLASQLVLGAANRRYDDYLASPDPVVMESRFRDARRLDHWSNALLVFGELAAAATLVAAWRAPGGHPVELAAVPAPGGAVVRVTWNP